MVNGVKLNNVKCSKGYIHIFDDCLCLCHLFISFGHKRLKEIIKSLVFCTVYFHCSKTYEGATILFPVHNIKEIDN